MRTYFASFAHDPIMNHLNKPDVVQVPAAAASEDAEAEDGEAGEDVTVNGDTAAAGDAEQTTQEHALGKDRSVARVTDRWVIRNSAKECFDYYWTARVF